MRKTRCQEKEGENNSEDGKRDGSKMKTDVMD